MIPNGFVQPFLVFRVCFRVFSWPIFSWIFVCFRSFFVAFRGCLLFSRNFRVFSWFFSWVFRGFFSCFFVVSQFSWIFVDFRGLFVDFRGFFRGFRIFVDFRGLFVVFRGFPLFPVRFRVFSWVFRGCFRGFFVVFAIFVDFRGLFVDFRGFFVVFRGFPLFSVFFFVFFKVRIFTRFHGQSTVFHGQMHTFSRANFSQGGTHGVIQPQNSQNNTLLSEWLSHFSYL